MIQLAEVSLGSGALVCARCGTPEARSARPAREVLAELASIAERWCGPGAPGVVFVGAEPFAHPELPALLDGATRAGFERIRLRTDGGVLAVGGNAAGAFGAGVRQVEVVLLGAGPKTHDGRAGRPGLFMAASEGAAAFRRAATGSDARVALLGRVPICRHNTTELPAMMAAFAGLGAVAVRLVARGDFDADLAQPWIAAALETALVNRVWAYVEAADAEWASQFGLHARAPEAVRPR